MARFARYWLVASIASAALTAAGRAQAELPCPLVLTPADQAEWQAAVRDVQAGARKGSAADCQSIHLAVLPDQGAELEFITTDGRVATRHLEGPAELSPAIEALLVTVAPPPAAPAATVIAAPPTPPTPPIARASNDGERRAQLVLGAGLGGRLTAARKYWAFATNVRAVGVLGKWELGVFGEWDPVYAPLGSVAPGAFGLSVLDVGAMLGRREQSGRLDVSYGVNWGVAALSESASANAAVADRSVDGPQQRVGAYVGSRFPRDASTRFTTELWFDAALSGLKRAATAAAQLPAFPRYGGVLYLGVETVLL
jgi:hypothetical protein